MSQNQELASFQHPAVLVQTGSDIEVWTKDEAGEPKQLAVVPSPKFRVDCACVEIVCDCLRAALDHVKPVEALDPAEQARRKLGRA